MDPSVMSLRDAYIAYTSGPDGLHENEASNRLSYGANTIAHTTQPTFITSFLAQFTNYVTWLLITLAFIGYGSYQFLGRHEGIFDAIIIGSIVLINASFGAYQDYHAEKTARTLSHLLSTRVIIKRAGKERKIPTNDLVVGDIILLEAGDRVPADCRIIHASDALVEQSILTGESVATYKDAKKLSISAPLAQRTNMLYTDTYIAQGSITALVIATGASTELGRLASQPDKTGSIFMQEVDIAARNVTYIALGLIILICAFLLFQGMPILGVILIASALIIGSVPESLFAVVTFSLAMGVKRLSRKNVLVKHRASLETFGSVDVICTDKTGTLTENIMKVRAVWANQTHHEEPFIRFGELLDTPPYRALKECALLSNEAENTITGFVGSAEDIALIDHYNRYPVVDILALQETHPLLALHPFTAKQHMSVALVKHEGYTSYAKGSIEAILEKSTHIAIDEQAIELDDPQRDRILARARAYATQGLRVIAFAHMHHATKPRTPPKRYIFLGLIAMHDPPKENIPETIKTLTEAHIAIKMITGDSIETAQAVAKACGFPTTRAIGWDELKDMSENQLKDVVQTYDIFARMTPQSKLRIVSALQAAGKRVAITGDGVNDVPALKKADVGVCVASGADIAQDASDIILLDNSLIHLTEALKEGRTVFANIRKVLNYLLTANFSEIFIILFGAFFNLLPITAIQLLWVNFITDIGPALALGQDPASRTIMRRKPTGAKEALINDRLILLTTIVTVKKVAILLALFFITLNLTDSLVMAQTAAFTWLVLAHIVRIVTLRFDEKVSFFINPLLNAVIIIPLTIHIVILYTPLGAFFSITPPTFFVWMLILGGIFLSMALSRIVTLILDVATPRTDEYT